MSNSTLSLNKISTSYTQKNATTLSRVERLLLLLLGVYFIVLCVSAFTMLPPLAIYYYWDWGRHLALSYYDNPPMIAYLLRGVTALFGNHIYVLNLFSVVSAYLTGFFLYKTTALIANRRAGLIAMSVWVLSPMVAQYIIHYSTYDTPLNLFWALSLFFAVRVVIQEQKQDWYYLSVALGCTMLSKYTGILLIAGLLLALVSLPPLRKHWRNPHFYLAIAVVLLIFSPVIIWNIQHQWVSVIYQLHTHVAGKLTFSQHLVSVWYVILKGMLPMFNVLLGIAVYGAYYSAKLSRALSPRFAHVIAAKAIRINTAKRMLWMITLTFIVFHLVAAWNARVLTSWLMPGTLTLVVLAAIALEQYAWKRTLYASLSLYILCSGIILFVSTVLAKQTKAGAMYQAAQQFNEAAETEGWQGTPALPIFTSDYLQARIMFYLDGQPSMYTLPGCAMENQYQFWSQDIVNAVRAGQVKSALYVADNPDTSCVPALFTHSVLLRQFQVEQHPLLSHQAVTRSLYVYRVWN